MHSCRVPASACAHSSVYTTVPVIAPSSNRDCVVASDASQIRPICVVDEARKWQDTMRACHGISFPCAVLCAALHAFASAPACRGTAAAVPQLRCARDLSHARALSTQIWQHVFVPTHAADCELLHACTSSRLSPLCAACFIATRLSWLPYYPHQSTGIKSSLWFAAVGGMWGRPIH